jgi:hypothetical protein
LEESRCSYQNYQRHDGAARVVPAAGRQFRHYYYRAWKAEVPLEPLAASRRQFRHYYYLAPRAPAPQELAVQQAVPIQ